MARRRYVSTRISTDSMVARLAREYGDFAALLYTWMIPHAEDDCSVESDHEEILLSVIPGLRHKTLDDIDHAIEGMKLIGLLLVDEDTGRYYFPPEAFYRYQTYVNAKNRRVGSAEDQRETPENAEERRESAENAASPSPSPSPSPSVSLSVSPSPSPSPLAAAAMRGWEGKVGFLPPSFVAEFREYADRVPAEWFEGAIEVTLAEADRPNWKFCKAVLDRAIGDNTPPRPAAQSPPMPLSLSEIRARSAGKRVARPRR